MTEATKNLNEAYRQKIIQLIGQTENTHILKCTYTTVHTHIQIENERKAVVAGNIKHCFNLSFQLCHFIR